MQYEKNRTDVRRESRLMIMEELWEALRIHKGLRDEGGYRNLK